MEIYVVQQGDNIYTIAERFGITVDKIIQDNGLLYPSNLAIGQTIIIAYPEQSYIVQQGDTLQGIADLYSVTVMQLLRNNPYLADRQYLYPGETLTISYNTVASITTNGFAYPYIRQETLIRTLPNLTYLSIFNYTTTEEGEILTYYDDSEIIQTSKDYSVIPLLMLSTLTPQGVPDIETAYNVLLNDEYQDRNINEFVEIMRRQGYLGLNLVFDFLNESNQSLYQNLVQKIWNRLQQEGFLFFITINYRMQVVDSRIEFEQIDYNSLSNYVDGIIYLRFEWGTNYEPPAPVSDINNIRALIDYVGPQVPPDKIIIGKPTIGYDWQLPYRPNESYAASLTINSVLELAYEVGVAIQFDEESQTPYFYYNDFFIGYPSQHIVWFVDARSIDVLDRVILNYGLRGSGVWNIMIYYQQLWTITNVYFDIIKLI